MSRVGEWEGYSLRWGVKCRWLWIKQKEVQEKRTSKQRREFFFRANGAFPSFPPVNQSDNEWGTFAVVALFRVTKTRRRKTRKNRRKPPRSPVYSLPG